MRLWAQLIAHLAETGVFLNLGLTVFTVRKGYNGGFIAWAIFVCLLGRAAHIYPLAWLTNRYGTLSGGGFGGSSGSGHSGGHGADDNASLRLPASLARAERRRQRGRSSLGTMPHALTTSEVHMVWFAGLRGAIAFACAVDFPGRFQMEFLATTMVIVLLTVFAMGGGTVPMLSYLGIRTGVQRGGGHSHGVGPARAAQQRRRPRRGAPAYSMLDGPQDEATAAVATAAGTSAAAASGSSVADRRGGVDVYGCAQPRRSRSHDAAGTGNDIPLVPVRSRLLYWDTNYIQPFFVRESNVSCAVAAAAQPGGRSNDSMRHAPLAMQHEAASQAVRRERSPSFELAAVSTNRATRLQAL